MLRLLKHLVRWSGLRPQLDAYVDWRIQVSALAKLDELALSTWDSMARAGITHAVRSDADGYRILCPTKSALGRLIFAGKFEPGERDFMKHFLRPGDTFVDIGANIGLFTLLGAKVVGSAGRIFAFEPNRETFAHLEDSIRLNGFENIERFNAGLSDRAGKLELITSLDGYDAWDSFGRPTAPGAFGTQSADVTTMDAFADAHGLAPRQTALLKMDVEGWEPFVLEGGTRFFADPSAPTLLVEFTERNLASAKRSAGELYELLRRFGYQMFTYRPAERVLVPEPFSGNYLYVNLIATKRPDEVGVRLRESTE